MKNGCAFKALSFFAAVLVAGACRTEEIGTETTVVHAGIGTAKTVLDYPEIHWCDGDKVCLNGIESSSAEVTGNGKTAVFQFSEIINPPYYGVYPSSALVPGSFNPSSGGYGKVVLPEVQNCVPGSFDPAAALLLAYSSTAEDELLFSCATAFMKITVSGENALPGIDSICLSAIGGEDMSGELNPATETGKTVSLNCKGTDINGVPLYLAIPAKTYSQGITIQITDGSRHFMKLSSDKSFTAVAGKIYPTSFNYVPNGTIVSTDIEGAEEAKIAGIEELNRNSQGLNSHAGECGRSAVEMDRRTMHILGESELGHPVLDYPRIKMLPNGSYILFYMPQRTGHSVYCSFSDDLEHWDGPHTVWGKMATVDPAGKADEIYFADGDMVVADNGDLLVFGTYRLRHGAHKYLKQWGITMKRSRDMGKTWGEEKHLYKTCVWEPIPIKLPSGEILVFFTDSDHDWDPTITGISLLRSSDNGYSWTVQAPVMRFASGWAYPRQLSLDMPAPQGDSTVRWTSQMPAVVLLNDRQTCLVCYETVNPKQDLRLSLAWEDSSWPTTLTGQMEGPAQRIQYMFGGSGPYLAQFPSGETLLSYSGLNWYLRLGNETGSDLNKQPFFTPYAGTSHWGNLELENSHTVLGTSARFHGTPEDPIYEQQRDILVAKFRLNHRIDIPRFTPVLDGKNNDWDDNTDAFFLGSESQCQCCFRFCYDDNYLYSLTDCLDENLSDGPEHIRLYFSDGQNCSSIREVEVMAAGEDIRTTRIPGTGFVTEVRIPLGNLPFNATDGIYFNAVMEYGEIQDTFVLRTLDDVSNWFHIHPQ
ncbi:MAG: exo-alpha-sialidase [Bacteroidales bacterium]|nr:exo-alpha-sialidase [Bacteroidales bacterium]